MDGRTRREMAFAQAWELYRTGRWDLPKAVLYLRRVYKAAREVPLYG